MKEGLPFSRFDKYMDTGLKHANMDTVYRMDTVYTWIRDTGIDTECRHLQRTQTRKQPNLNCLFTRAIHEDLSKIVWSFIVIGADSN